MIEFTAAEATPSPEAPAPCSALDRSREENEVRRRELEALSDEIARLSAHVQAATYRLLVMIRTFDDRKGWYEEGFRSCASWLAWRTNITPGAAREKVRVARALETLPTMSRAVETGAMSYSVARALTRVATPDNEAELTEVAACTPASQVARLVRRWRSSDKAAEELRDREEERHQGRELWLSPAADGSYRVHGRLDPEAGAVLRKALEAAEEALFAVRREAASASGGDDPGEDAGPGRPPRRTRWADALGLVAEAALGEGLGEGSSVVGRAERFQVVVHVTEEVLQGQDEREDHASRSRPAVGLAPPEIAGGPTLFGETASRLACDAGVVAMTHDRAGSILDVGRKSRAVPPALRRALDHRDGGCRFPGCACRYCEAHHIVHWARGGATRLQNLVLLCRRHHRLLHEGGWRMTLGADRTVRFLRPDGRELPAVPEPVPVPADPLAVMERAHHGLGIDAWTATPDWDGVPMDVDWALAALAPPLPASAREQAPKGREQAAAREPTEAAASEPPAPINDPSAQPSDAVDASAEAPRLRGGSGPGRGPPAP